MSQGAIAKPETALAIERADFTAGAVRVHDQMSAYLTGTADLDIKGALDDFLTNLHETACAERLAEVTMDFTGLKFMNSSCLKGVVTWICRVHDLPPHAQYRITLVSTPEMHWQRRSLHALSCLAPELVSVR